MKVRVVTHLSGVSVPQLQADPLLHLHVGARTQGGKNEYNKGKLKIKSGSEARAHSSFLLQQTPGDNYTSMFARARPPPRDHAPSWWIFICFQSLASYWSDDDALTESLPQQLIMQMCFLRLVRIAKALLHCNQWEGDHETFKLYIRPLFVLIGAIFYWDLHVHS